MRYKKRYKLFIALSNGGDLDCLWSVSKESVMNAGAGWAHWCPDDIVMFVEEDNPA